MKFISLLFILIFSFSVCAQHLELLDFSFSPDSIDTQTGAKTVTFTVKASETDSVTLMLHPVGSSSIGGLNLPAIGGGVFQTTFTYPENSPQRIEEIYGITLADDVKHEGYTYWTTDLTDLGFKTTFQIIGSAVSDPVKKRKRVRFF